MRVLYWTRRFWPSTGGVEVLETKLPRALDERGFQLRVATSHGSLELPDRIEYGGVPSDRFPFGSALAERYDASCAVLFAEASSRSASAIGPIGPSGSDRPTRPAPTGQTLSRRERHE